MLPYLKKPLVVPAGSKVYVTGTYDNTKKKTHKTPIRSRKSRSRYVVKG